MDHKLTLADKISSNDRVLLIVAGQKDELWHRLIRSTKWQLNQIDSTTTYLNEGLNLSILITTCSIIEGILSDLIFDQVESHYNDNSKILKEFLHKKSSKAGWGELKELFEVAFNKKISQLINNENLKAIQTLFQLRNNIVHGSTYNPEIHLQTWEGGKSRKKTSNKNYNDTINYLREKKLLKKENTGGVIDFADKTISLYFFQQAKQFIIQILENIDVENSEKYKSRIEDAFEN